MFVSISEGVIKALRRMLQIQLFQPIELVCFCLVILDRQSGASSLSRPYWLRSIEPFLAYLWSACSSLNACPNFCLCEYTPRSLRVDVFDTGLSVYCLSSVKGKESIITVHIAIQISEKPCSKTKKALFPSPRAEPISGPQKRFQPKPASPTSICMAANSQSSHSVILPYIMKDNELK
jgi:hypothetical protein